MFDIRDHSGSFGSNGGGIALKFSKVSTSLTQPENPKDYEIWLECNDVLNKVYFSNTDVELTEGDVQIGASSLVEVTKSILKSGKYTLNSTPKIPKPNNRRIATSSIVDVWADLGVAKIKRGLATNYINAYIYFNSSWFQFSVSEDVFAYTRTVHIDSDDTVTPTGGPSVNGFSIVGRTVYNPINKTFISATTANGGGYFYHEILDTKVKPLAIKYISRNVADYPSILSMSRDYLMGAGNNKRLTVRLHDETMIARSKESTLGGHQGNGAYLEKYDVLVVPCYDTGAVYNLMAFDISAARNAIPGSMEVPMLIGIVTTLPNFRGSIAGTKNGEAIIVQGSGPSSFKLTKFTHNLTEIVSAPTPEIPYHPSDLKLDKDENIYILSPVIGGATPTSTLLKYTKDFKFVWSLSLPIYGDYLTVTKEGIIFATPNAGSAPSLGRICKVNTKGQLISIIETKLSLRNLASSSPEISAFPEYW